MSRWAALAIAFALGSFVCGNAVANDDDNDDRGRRHGRAAGPESFIGLWQGIDSFDGSTQRLSITCSGRDECDVRLNDSLFTLSCENQIGFARGIGKIEGGVLSVDLTLTCKGTDGEDVVVEQFNQFIPDRRNRTLTNLNDDPGVAKIFHRISQ